MNLFFLFLDHFIEYWHQPLFKLAVVVIRCKQVANAVNSSVAQVATGQVEVTDVCRRETFDEIFFDATRRRHHAVDLNKLQGYL